MANLETMLIKFMGGGSGSKPPPENSVLPVPAVETTLVDSAVVAPPPAGFVAATAVTMPVGAGQHPEEHREKRLGIGALPHGSTSTSTSPIGVAPSGPAPIPVTGTPSQDGGARPSLKAVAPPMSYADVPIKMPHISMHGNPPKLDTTNFALW